MWTSVNVISCSISLFPTITASLQSVCSEKMHFPNKAFWVSGTGKKEAEFLQHRVTVKHTLCTTVSTPHSLSWNGQNSTWCEKGSLKLKAMVNSRALWPRHGPRDIAHTYQCWWCLAVTEPDWQLLSARSLSSAPVMYRHHAHTKHEPASCRQGIYLYLYIDRSILGHTKVYHE